MICSSKIWEFNRSKGQVDVLVVFLRKRNTCFYSWFHDWRKGDSSMWSLSGRSGSWHRILQWIGGKDWWRKWRRSGRCNCSSNLEYELDSRFIYEYISVIILLEKCAWRWEWQSWLDPKFWTELEKKTLHEEEEEATIWSKVGWIGRNKFELKRDEGTRDKADKGRGTRTRTK